MNRKSAVSRAGGCEPGERVVPVFAGGDAQSTASNESGAARHLPEYAANGKLVLPKDWRH
jgi:hypothetical protein